MVELEKMTIGEMVRVHNAARLWVLQAKAEIALKQDRLYAVMARSGDPGAADEIHKLKVHIFDLQRHIETEQALMNSIREYLEALNFQNVLTPGQRGKGG